MIYTGNLKNIEQLYHAIDLYKAGQYEEANIILEKLQKKYKKDKQIMYYLGRVKIRLNDEKGAKKYFRECIRIYPRNIHARVELARIYSKAGEYKRAEKELLKCMEIQEGKSEFATYELAKLNIIFGKYEEAEQYFLKSLELGNKDARLALARLYILENRNEEAELYIKQSMLINGDKRAYERLELGKLYLKQEKYDEAEEQFKKCIEISGEKSISAIMGIEKIHAIRGKNKEEQDACTYIMDNLDEENYTLENRMEHIKLHTKNDLQKNIHGVFTMKLEDVIKQLDFHNCKRYKNSVTDFYCFKIEGCGYEGGRLGSGETLNYVTVITLANNVRAVITMFPSKEIKFKTKELEHDER